jgi:hypothetical protein
MKTCAHTDCKNDCFGDSDSCALHCEKHSYQDDRHSGLLFAFTTALIDHLIGQIKPITEGFFDTDEDVIKNYLLGKVDGETQAVADNLKNRLISIEGVSFPDRDSRDFFDYQKVLNHFDAVQFVRCRFYTSSVSLSDADILFYDSIFEVKWYLSTATIISDIDDTLYNSCTFKKDVGTLGYDHPIIDYPVFQSCLFEGSINIEDIELSQQLFKEISEGDDGGYEIAELKIVNSTIAERLIFKKCHIGRLILQDTNFTKKFELVKCTVDRLKCFNTNYNDAFNVFDVSFGFCDIRVSIFEQYFGMEKCEFGKRNAGDSNAPVIFEYVTFNDIVNFRNSNFTTGLNLSHINTTLSTPTFLGATVSEENTVRETYRIIKHSFDNMGNYLEGNEYYQKEMLKYHEEHKSSNSYPLRFFLWLYKNISDYGQNIWRPIWLALVSTALFSAIVYGYDHGLYIDYATKIGKWIWGINYIASNMLPVSRLLKPGMEMLSLIFYLFLISFVWLTLLGVKRKTRR